jgi:hypothetical protein
MIYGYILIDRIERVNYNVNKNTQELITHLEKINTNVYGELEIFRDDVIYIANVALKIESNVSDIQRDVSDIQTKIKKR